MCSKWAHLFGTAACQFWGLKGHTDGPPKPGSPTKPFGNSMSEYIPSPAGCLSACLIWVIRKEAERDAGLGRTKTESEQPALQLWHFLNHTVVFFLPLFHFLVTADVLWWGWRLISAIPCICRFLRNPVTPPSSPQRLAQPYITTFCNSMYTANFTLAAQRISKYMKWPFVCDAWIARTIWYDWIICCTFEHKPCMSAGAHPVVCVPPCKPTLITPFKPLQTS